MPPHCREINDSIGTDLPGANVQPARMEVQWIAAPLGMQRPPMALIDRLNRRAAARERRINRQWAPYLRTRRMSLAFMQDFSHFFEQIHFTHYLDDTFVQIRRVPRRTLLDLRLELPWPVRRCTDLALRPAWVIALPDDRRLWLWEITWLIMVRHAGGDWSLQRSEYIAFPRCSHRNRGHCTLILTAKVIALTEGIASFWCYIHA